VSSEREMRETCGCVWFSGASAPASCRGAGLGAC
jgi:hypothetical protein